MNIQESGEMYLETIYRLKEQKATVHSVDIVEEMGFAKSSVSRGISVLKKRGYLTVDEIKGINLTEAGEKVAVTIYARHKLLTDYLVRLGVSRKTAEDDACKIEHDISEETFAALKKHGEKIK